MTYVITDNCLDIMDRSCVMQCPVDCIHPGKRMLYIDPDSCIDCGACESVCPQKAIFFDEDLPGALGSFAEVNAEFFGQGLDGSDTDHPAVAGLPVNRVKDQE